MYYLIQNNLSRVGIRATATSKIEHFVIIVNGFQPLIIITKSSILDVEAVLDPPLLLYKNSYFAHVLNLFLKREYLKVFFKRREVLFKINFLEVLKKRASA